MNAMLCSEICEKTRKVQTHHFQEVGISRGRVGPFLGCRIRLHKGGRRHTSIGFPGPVGRRQGVRPAGGTFYPVKEIQKVEVSKTEKSLRSTEKSLRLMVPNSRDNY